MIFGQKKKSSLWCTLVLELEGRIPILSLYFNQMERFLTFFNFLRALLRAQINRRVLIRFVQLGSMFYIIMLILCAQKMHSKIQIPSPLGSILINIKISTINVMVSLSYCLFNHLFCVIIPV